MSDADARLAALGALEVRTMVAADIPAGLRLCRASNWNQVEADWRLFLSLNPAGCSVIVRAGEVLGTVVTVDYQGRMSWIGMVLVDPAVRRAGIGTRLLRLAIEHLHGCETLKLDATPAGREVYLPLGFVDEYGIRRMVCEAAAAPPAEPGPAVEPLSEAHLPAVLELDREVFGADRSTVLRAYAQAYPHYARVCLEAGRPSGYCLGRQGHGADQIGPVVAYRPEVARALVAHLLAGHRGRPFLTDAMLHDLDWIAWLEAAGFREQRPFTRMYRGPNRHPGRPQLQYTILAPELG